MASKSSVDHKVTIEDVGPSRKRLRFVIPAKTVEQQCENQLDMVASQAPIPGFRPGRAPRRLVEKRFGPTVRTEAKGQLISSAYAKAIEDHKLPVVGEPEGNDELARLEVAPGHDMAFYLDVEVMPEFELPALEGIEVLKPIIEPTQAQVDEQVQRLAINEGSLEGQDEAAPGDYCIGHGILKDAATGKSLIDINGAVIQVPPADKDGKGAILGVLVDDFAKQIGKPKAGVTLTVKTKGPEHHENEDVRNKDVVIEFEVQRVERIIPMPMADLVKKYGFESEATLRENVMARLSQRALVEQRAAMQEQVARYLLNKVTMTLPERLTARQSERNLSRARMDLMYRGLDETQVEERMAQLRRSSSAQAARDLKLGFVLAKAADTMNVDVTQEEVMGRIQQIAMERGVRADEMYKQLAQRNQIMHLAQQIREHKALDRMLAKAKISEIGIDEFNKKMSAQA